VTYDAGRPPPAAKQALGFSEGAAPAYHHNGSISAAGERRAPSSSLEFPAGHPWPRGRSEGAAP